MGNNLPVKKEDESLGIFNQESRKQFDKIIKYLASIVKRRSKIKTKHKSYRRKIGKKKNEKTGKWEDLFGDYLKVNYFKELLNKEFPDLWDWLPAHQPVFANNRLVITDGVLKVFIKERFELFIKLGVSPDVAIGYAWKSYYSVASDYFQFNEKGNPISKSGPPKTSNTEAWKKATNMGTSLGDDTYHYDEDLVMSIEIIEENKDKIMELDIPDVVKELYCDKLIGFQEYQLDSFFKAIESNLPTKRIIAALDVLVELYPNSIQAFDLNLKSQEQEHINQNKGEMNE